MTCVGTFLHNGRPHNNLFFPVVLASSFLFFFFCIIPIFFWLFVFFFLSFSLQSEGLSFQAFRGLVCLVGSIELGVIFSIIFCFACLEYCIKGALFALSIICSL